MKFYGYLCEVENPYEIIKLSKKVRDAGYSNFDTYSPFPIHGIDKAMGLPASILPWFSLVGCFVGLTAAIAMQVWMNGIDYKIALSGKPYIAFPAFIPVTFELTILFTAFFTVFGMSYSLKSRNNGSSYFEIFSIPLTPQDVKNSRPNLTPPI